MGGPLRFWEGGQGDGLKPGTGGSGAPTVLDTYIPVFGFALAPLSPVTFGVNGSGSIFKFP